jgi:Mn-dependent DtxR family transcriptional regulator
MENNEKLILEAIKKAGKPVRPGDIAKILGIDSKEVSKIIKVLKIKDKIYSPKRCYYSPKA